jgi:hypothetical protein
MTPGKPIDELPAEHPNHLSSGDWFGSRLEEAFGLGYLRGRSAPRGVRVSPRR